ncbi:hypothetical protein DFQ27_009532 [Actinomortierella ambigua]|uniref:Uncharacterized protein n=1 Tax=Actinomortierella ambigua TaxID=1343610 RepID=A0A9P6UAT9_9FUNG|nr:hypothetical protein DFQ27_009532 [Actinomortierella ambigua]
MLFKSSQPKDWESVLSKYIIALEHHVAGKRDNELLKLDKWYQTELPILLAKRKPLHIDSKELVKLMSWKLKRGKFRPTLAKQAASNADNDVKAISEAAFAALHQSGVRPAIVKMAELKGVGPATASAILCAGAPDKVPFMADETMESVPGLGTIAYTVPYYMKFADKVIEKAKELQKKGSTVNTPHLVEKALWVEFMLDKYNVSKDEDEDAGPSTAVTKDADNELDDGKATGEKSSATGTKRKRVVVAALKPDDVEDTPEASTRASKKVVTDSIETPGRTRSSTRSRRT